MAMILSFQFRLDKPVAKQQLRGTKGQIIIFPGVRYERLPDASLTLTKTVKKARKTA